jgi:uncharacterized protein
MKKIIASIALAALAAGPIAYAQTASANTAVPGAPSAAKKELLQRLMTLQQPALENMARNLAEQPVRQMMAAAEQAMPNVPEAKREAAAKQIQADAKKYSDEANGIVKERAAKLGQSVLTPLFDEKFTEDELRQLLVSLEAPAYKKYQAALPDLSNAFAEKLIEDLRPVLDPKLKALEQSVGKALGLDPAGGGSSKPAGKAKK